MKNVAIFLFSLFLHVNAFSQVNLEGQLGGSNFLGFSLNTEVDIPLSKSKAIYLSPSMGLGLLSPTFEESTAILRTGLHLKYKKWGIGSEVAGFTGNPFSNQPYINSFIDLLVYPNVNYTFNFKSNYYLKASTGAYVAFSRVMQRQLPLSNDGPYPLRFQGDAIPGIGLSFGYKFR